MGKNNTTTPAATAPGAATSTGTPVDMKAAYAGSSNLAVAAKHNSWGGGIPQGVYSDAKDDTGRLETFGFQKDAEGALILKDGLPIALKQPNNPDKEQAGGRYIINQETGGRYKVYNSMLNGLTTDQRVTLTNADAGAVVFQETEMRVDVVVKEGRTSFEFKIA